MTRRIISALLTRADQGIIPLVNVPQRRTAVDWAYEMKELLDVDYPYAKKVILVCDNLNTHKAAFFYGAFEPQEARRLFERLEIHYTPKHGSWLNIAEIELNVFTRQCLDRRIPDFDTLQRESKSWYTKRNTGQKSVRLVIYNGQSTGKLKRLCSQIKTDWFIKTDFFEGNYSNTKYQL